MGGHASVVELFHTLPQNTLLDAVTSPHEGCQIGCALCGSILLCSSIAPRQSFALSNTSEKCNKACSAFDLLQKGFVCSREKDKLPWSTCTVVGHARFSDHFCLWIDPMLAVRVSVRYTRERPDFTFISKLDAPLPTGHLCLELAHLFLTWCVCGLEAFVRKKSTVVVVVQ